MHTSSLTTLEQKALKLIIDDTRNGDQLSIKEIGQWLGITSYKVKEIIHSLRKQGFPVCNNSYGYFYARSVFELKKCIRNITFEVGYLTEEMVGMNRSFDKVGGVVMDVFITKMVRVGPDKVVQRKFKIGDDGQPIIPPGVEIL